MLASLTNVAGNGIRSTGNMITDFLCPEIEDIDLEDLKGWRDILPIKQYTLLCFKFSNRVISRHGDVS